MLPAEIVTVKVSPSWSSGPVFRMRIVPPRMRLPDIVRLLAFGVRVRSMLRSRKPASVRVEVAFTDGIDASVASSLPPERMVTGPLRVSEPPSVPPDSTDTGPAMMPLPARRVVLPTVTALAAAREPGAFTSSVPCSTMVAPV